MKLLGYYYSCKDGVIDFPQFDHECRLMAEKYGCTSIWLRHANAENTGIAADFVAPYGIKVVAACREINASTDAEEWKRRPEYWNVAFPRALIDYGASADPLAWCLGDEPPDIEDYGEYLKAWEDLCLGEPSCLVVNHNNIDQYVGTVPFVCHNEYPFRTEWHWSTIRAHWLRSLLQPVPWQMGQLHHGEEWGLRAPSPAEAKWQVYTAAAMGRTGYWAFSWNYPEPPDQTLLAATGEAFRRVVNWPDLPHDPSINLTDAIIRTSGRLTLIVADLDPISTTYKVPGYLLQNVETGKLHFGWRGTVSLTVQPGEAVWVKRMA